MVYIYIMYTKKPNICKFKTPKCLFWDTLVSYSCDFCLECGSSSFVFKPDQILSMWVSVWKFDLKLRKKMGIHFWFLCLSYTNISLSKLIPTYGKYEVQNRRTRNNSLSHDYCLERSQANRYEKRNWMLKKAKLLIRRTHTHTNT